MVIDRVTGEEVDVKIFVEKINSSRWEKAYAKVIANYINCSGDKSAQFLAYLIEYRDSKNRIIGTQATLAKKAQVSDRCAKKVIKTLKEKGLIKMLQSGLYMITPKMICVGRGTHGAVLMQIWGDLDKPANKQKNPKAVFDVINNLEEEDEAA
jgi:uncharacterized protein YjhX (UPF0386 family)